jgi:hypothetical protein
MSWSTYFDLMLYKPCVAYILWFAVYALINFVIAAESIRKMNYDSTYKYWKRKPYVKKFMDKHPSLSGPLIFLAFHFSYFFITLLYALVQYHFKLVNELCIVALLINSAWNGACFYMEYFSRRYEEQLAQLKQIEEKTKTVVIDGVVVHVDVDEAKPDKPKTE